jgi:hypothetical protein
MSEEKKELTQADLPEIVRRYVNGESIQTIAGDSRRSRQTIYNWIHTVGEQQYPDIVRQAMITRMADADEDLHNAGTLVDIARASSECRYTRWDLERRWASQFGPKQELSVKSVTVIVQRPVQELPQTPLPIDEASRHIISYQKPGI